MGTWTAPQTTKQARKLEKLLKKPLLAKDAGDALYDLIGDDDLFDNIDLNKDHEDADVDIRIHIADCLRKCLEDLEAFVKPWEPEAITICWRIVKAHEL